MDALKQLNLKENEKRALLELKARILEKFPDAEIILYGSKAKGNADDESDMDVLILLDREINNALEEEIFHISYEIELKHGVVFGEIVENKDFWVSPKACAMPLHRNIDKEGIAI